MICPECHAEYLEHIEKCGDCNISLVDACILDLPIPEMTWASLPPFEGKVYADMIAEIFDKNEIPYYLAVLLSVVEIFHSEAKLQLLFPKMLLKLSLFGCC